MTNTTRLTLTQIFANVSAAKNAELSNETAFISELIAHTGNSQNVRNISFYLNAMSVKQLGSMAVYRDFLLKHTNFEIAFADSKTKVFSNGDLVATNHADYAQAEDYKHWFRSQLVTANLNDDAQAVNSSLIYVCRGFSKKPKDAKSDAESGVVEATEKRQAEWELRKANWTKFCAGEPIDLVVAYDEINRTEDDKATPVIVTVSDYGTSITAFMSRLASLTRSAKLAMTKEQKTDAQKIKSATDALKLAIEKLAKLTGGEAAVKAVLTEQLASITDFGNGNGCIIERTSEGRILIPTPVTRNEAGQWVVVTDTE